MKKFSLAFSLFYVLSACTIYAQTLIYSQVIKETKIYLRGDPYPLARIDVNLPSDGIMVVRFDGECYVDLLDRIIVAASDKIGWTPNWGNVGIESTYAEIGKSFSHTRAYKVNAGLHSFYAIGHNYVKTDGSGIASIYGTLTAEFFPAGGSAVAVDTGFYFGGDVTDVQVAAQRTIHVSEAGKIIVHIDGWCVSDVGDRIVLAASNTTNWTPFDGNVMMEASDHIVDKNSYSHTREYDVPAAGDYTFYAVAQNVEETDGNGWIDLYGTLLVEFYPNSGENLIGFKGFSQPSINLRGPVVELTSVTINAPGPGTVVVDFDGDMTSDPGDDLTLAASDSIDWYADDGNLTLTAVDEDLNRNSIAHSRVYTVGKGSHTFYATGQNFLDMNGSGIANIFGQLTVKYFPEQSTAVEDVVNSLSEFVVFPDPTHGQITISFHEGNLQHQSITLMDVNGRILNTYERTDNEDVIIDLISYPSGIYLVKSGDKVKKVMKQ